MNQEKNLLSLDKDNLKGHLDAPKSREYDSNQILPITGWIFSTDEPITNLAFTVNDQKEEYLPYPLFRPDVGAAHPGYSQASFSGFATKYSVPENFTGILHLKIWITYESGEKRCAWTQIVDTSPEEISEKLTRNLKELKHGFSLGVKRTKSLTKELFLVIPQTTQKIYTVWKLSGINGVKDKTYNRIVNHPLRDYVFRERDWSQHISRSKDDNYQKWLNKNYPNPTILQGMVRKSRLLDYKPRISIIMPVFNPPVEFFKAAIASVINQAYPHWELCIADDASTNPQIRALLEGYTAKDQRIKVVFRPINGHISACSNSALEIATGEFVAFFDHDDLLTLDALYEVASFLNRHPEADMIYSDEDKIDENNQLFASFFKPDWCPDSFLCRMYTCHLGVYRRELINAIGGFRVGYEGSQDYDLVLRLTEKTKQIFHIPKILYHWRSHASSTSNQSDQKPYAFNAAKKALLDTVTRRGEEGIVLEAQGLTNHYIIRYQIKDYQLVSIIIPTKDLGDILDRCLASIFEKTTYPNYEVILIDNNSQEEKTAKIIAKWQLKEPNRFRCDAYHIPFNYSKINNYAVGLARGDYLLFLNNDTEVITPDWIEAMVEQVQRPSIGAVGALLLYPDDTIQHAGVILGLGGVAGHVFNHFPGDIPGYYGQVLSINNYLAVTAACLMCRREVFIEVGGFEEEIAVAFNDVDLCLKMVTKGYNNIYLPHVTLYHYESKSRGHENTPEKHARFLKEVNYMQHKWGNHIEQDPCYSIHLTLNSGGCETKI